MSLLDLLMDRISELFNLLKELANSDRLVHPSVVSLTKDTLSTNCLMFKMVSSQELFKNFIEQKTGLSKICKIE